MSWNWRPSGPRVVQCCGKATWAQQADALIALKRIQLDGHTEVRPIRVYRCRHGAWHLTSKELYEEEAR